MFFLYTILLAYLLSGASGSSILAIFPFPYHDDQFFFSTLTRELARNGHSLVVITPDPRYHQMLAGPKYRIIDTSSIYEQRKEFSMTDPTDTILDRAIATFVYSQVVKRSFENQLTNPEVQEILTGKKEKFDLVLADGYLPATFGLADHFKVPFVNAVSRQGLAAAYDAIGNPSHPLLHGDTLTDWQANNVFNRLVTGYTQITDHSLRGALVESLDELLKKYLNVSRSVTEIASEAAVTLVNGHVLTSGLRPLLPTVQFVGGIHLRSARQLPEDIQTFVDSVKDNIIYVNLGQGLERSSSPFDREKLLDIVNYFETLEYRFIWMWDGDLPRPTKKTRFVNDRDLQQDILAQAKVKLFVTQGDMASVEEAIYHEKPMVVVPTRFGLHATADYVVRNLLGEKSDTRLSEIVSVIHSVRGDRRYKKNLIKMKKLMFDQPQSHAAKAVNWIEYAIRHNGTAHLRAPTLPFYQYFFLDAIAFGISSVIIGLYLTYRITKFWIKFWWRQRLIFGKIARLFMRICRGIVWLSLSIKNGSVWLYRFLKNTYESKKSSRTAVEKKKK